MTPDTPNRRLAAILSADVVGYSRLMAEDEAETVRTLGAYRDEMALLVQQHRGRVVDFTGDNLLAEFPTATDAVRAAVEIQRILQVRNDALAAERRMQFRIGVHLGEVRAEGERLYGDGVNIAARLEGLAEPGGVCVSRTVHEQVRTKLALPFEDLGEHTVKNIPEPVRVYRVQFGEPKSDTARLPSTGSGGVRVLGKVIAAVAVVSLLAGVTIWATWPRPLGLVLDLTGVGDRPEHPPLPDTPSVAVLPFDNMSGDPEQEYFSDGITEELTNDLAQNPELFVIARNSAFSYKGRPVNVEEVGRELGVRYVVEGSVRRSVDRVRVTVQLIDATTGFHLWSEQYDRELADIFDVQSEISRAIFVALGAEIHDATIARGVGKFTRDLLAYDLFLKAVSHYRRFTRDDNLEARRLLERAIEHDPNFAMAIGLLGHTYSIEYHAQWNLDETLLERAEELAQRALELDATAAPAYPLLAGVHFLRGQFDEALDLTERAVDLNPNLDNFHAGLAIQLAAQGRFVAALRSIDRALRLNPRGTSVAWTVAAWVNLAAGRADKAVAILERERAANADTINARIPLAAIYEGEGRHGEAREVVEEILQVNPNLTTETMVPLALFFGEDRAREFKENLHKAGLPDKAPDTGDFTVPGFGTAPAIAVLPFDNLSGDPDQEYFADGIAEDLITRLSGWGGFPVIARNSSFTYKGTPVDVKQVGQELGARYVVEGSVRKAADRIRIAAQLIDASTGRHVWAETYDRDLSDIFAVQDEITKAIVAGMGSGLLQSETIRAARANPRSLSAYDLRMRGLWHLWKYSKKDVSSARTFFEKAIELDGEDAYSFGGLALSHYLTVLYGWSDAPERSLEEQFQAARRCAELNETLPQCQVPLGLAYALRGRRQEAIGAVTLAVDLNPSDTFARTTLCYFLGVTGTHDEGIGHCKTSLRLDPRGPGVWMMLHLVAFGHFGAGRYEEAVQWERRSLRRRRHYWVAHGTLAASQAHLGNVDEARTALQEMLQLNPQVSAEGIRMIFAPAHDEFIGRWIEGLRKAGWEG